MTRKPLGRLERMDLREIWATEAQDFTPWLAQPENLEVLAETLNMELELEAQEKNVGPFRADILCKNADDGSWVLVENQLERTDHLHLGQLLTYAAGLQAVTIVWVAAKFTEEHRATLDWLNEITDENFRFFGLQVELWRIADSPPAPRFNIISKPNDWTRSVSQAARQIAETGLTDTKIKQKEFWTNLKAQAEDMGRTSVRIPNPQPKHWMDLGIGRSGIVMTLAVNSFDNRISVAISLKDENAKPYFHLLKEDKESIESEIGEPLDWRELPDKKMSRIILYKNSVDPLDESGWPQQHAWMLDAMEKFNKVFRPRIKELNADEWRPEEETP